MNTLGQPSPATTTTTSCLSAKVPKLSSKSSVFAGNRNCCCLVFGNGYSSSSSSLSQFSSRRLVSVRLRKSVIVAAKKEFKKTDKKAIDTHSFAPKSDEATGPFPESVLLKQKKVQEDGSLLPEFADLEERELFEQLNLQLESDLNVEQMRHYEVVYLIHEDHAKEVESVNLKVQEFIKEKNGKIWRFSDWGLRRLAYKIKRAKNAHYILMNFELEAKCINEFKNMLDKDERVIRHLVMKRDEAETADCPPPPEFHTVHSGMDNDDDDNDDDEYDIDDAYDDEEDGKDWDEEGEEDIAVDDNDTENGTIYVEDYIDESGESKNSSKPSNVSSMERMKVSRPKKVGR